MICSFSIVQLIVSSYIIFLSVFIQRVILCIVHNYVLYKWAIFGILLAPGIMRVCDVSAWCVINDCTWIILLVAFDLCALLTCSVRDCIFVITLRLMPEAVGDVVLEVLDDNLSICHINKYTIHSVGTQWVYPSYLIELFLFIIFDLFSVMSWFLLAILA